MKGAKVIDEVHQPMIWLEGGGEVSMQQRDIGKWDIHVHASYSEQAVTIRKYYLPHMQLIDVVTNKPVPLSYNELGYTRFLARKGSQHLRLVYKPLPMQTLSVIISILMLCFLAGAYMFRLKNIRLKTPSFLGK